MYITWTFQVISIKFQLAIDVLPENFRLTVRYITLQNWKHNSFATIPSRINLRHISRQGSQLWRSYPSGNQLTFSYSGSLISTLAMGHGTAAPRSLTVTTRWLNTATFSNWACKLAVSRLEQGDNDQPAAGVLGCNYSRPSLFGNRLRFFPPAGGIPGMGFHDITIRKPVAS